MECNNLKLGYLPKWFEVPARISDDIDVVTKTLGKAKDYYTIPKD